MAAETPISLFKNLRIIHTEKDLEALRIILEGSQYEKVFCDNCESSKFDIQVIGQGVVTISFDSEIVVILKEKIDEISAVSVIKCAVCGCKDYVIERKAPKGEA